MDTKLFQKNTLKVSHSKVLYNVIEIVLLILIGAVGVLLHAKLRIPMKLPGKHGMIFMSILIAGRLLSGKSYASSLSSIGAATMLLFPGLGFKDPYMPLIYLMPGYIVDILYYYLCKIDKKFYILILICGLAYTTIPLSRFLITFFTGYYYDTFSLGYLYPFVSHFIFGTIGGVLGTSVILGIKKKKNQKSV